MFKLKYKMHRLVNTIFNFIIFSIGFILGGGNIEKVKEFFTFIFNI